MMKLGVRNDCVLGADLRDKMNILKALGYDFVELALKEDQVENLSTEQIEELKAVASGTKMPIKQTSMGHFPLFATKEPAERDRLVRHIERFVDLTSKLGGDVILLATKEPSDDVSSYAPIYSRELENVADYAQEQGVTLALEPVGRIRSSTIDKLVREIAHPAIRMYYDMGNCLYGGEDPVEQAQLSADITAAIHVGHKPFLPAHSPNSLRSSFAISIAIGRFL